MNGIPWTVASVALGILLGCSGGGTGPGTGGACSPVGTVTLSVNQGTTLDCSTGTTITLAGNGATYLLVPQFATGNVAYQSQPFTLSRRGPESQSAASPSVASVLSQHQLLNYRQAAFDLKMLKRGRHMHLNGSIARADGAGLPATGWTAAADTLNQRRSFHVIGDSTGSTFKTSVAQLRYLGAHVYVYIDTAAPKNGFTPLQLSSFGKLVDSVLYQLDANTFGPPTDIDHNGHVIMLLTQIVNSLTPSGTCNSGFIAGFFNPLDFDTTVANSNKGEIFYQVVPDPTGSFSCAHSVATVVRISPGTFLHELQHMINFGQHTIVHGSQSSEEGWLDEGESIVATELGARYYEHKFPPPTGRTNPNQLFPDSAEPYITEQLFDSYHYLTAPDTQSLTLHSDADGGLDWRGGDWLLLRYIGDQFDSTVYQRLDQSNLTGTANVANATGKPFATVFGNFGLALYTDSLPGVPRASIPTQYRFVSRNLRQLYQALYNSSPMMNGINSPFPINLQATTGGGTTSVSSVPGTNDFFQLTAGSAATVTVKFGMPGGARFDASLHPQVNVFRTQ